MRRWPKLDHFLVKHLSRRLRKQARDSAAIAARMWKIAVVATKHASLHWVIDPFRRKRGSVTVPAGPIRLKQFFEDIGGSYLKLGQMLALQPDLVPPKYCDALFDLMDRVTPFSAEIAREIFFDEIGESVDDAFEAFEDRPLSTASIGQVHVAFYKGQKVAVKIQRPAAEAGMIPDIQIAALVIKTIRLFRFKPLWWMIEPMSEFIRWTWEELDYRHETRYAVKAMENARGEAFEHVPKVYEEFTTRRIAVFEFLEGVTVLDVIRLREKLGFIPDDAAPAGFKSADFCVHIIDNFLDGAFTCGLFHADLHPANLMIMKNNVVGYIDYGITGVLAEYSRKNLIALTLAYSQGQVEEMGEIFVRVSKITADSDYGVLRRGLKRCSKNWYGSEGKTSVTGMMLDFLKLSREANIWPQRDVIKYIRCSVAMDGLIKRLDPEFDVGAALARASRKHLETGLRLHIYSYDRLFRGFSEITELAVGGTATLRNALANVARAVDPNPGNPGESAS